PADLDFDGHEYPVVTDRAERVNAHGSSDKFTGLPALLLLVLGDFSRNHHKLPCDPQARRRIASPTSVSQRSLSSTPACPLTHSQRASTFATGASSCSHNSLFFTGSFEAVRHPLRFHFTIHWVIPFLTYWLSVRRQI